MSEWKSLNNLFHVLITNRLAAFFCAVLGCLWHSHILSRVVLDEPKSDNSLLECGVQHFEHVVDGVISIAPLILSVHPFLNGSTRESLEFVISEVGLDVTLNHLLMIENSVSFHVHLDIVLNVVVHVIRYGAFRWTENAATFRVFLVRLYACVVGFFLGFKTAFFDLLVFPCNLSQGKVI